MSCLFYIASQLVNRDESITFECDCHRHKDKTVVLYGVGLPQYAHKRIMEIRI